MSNVAISALLPVTSFLGNLSGNSVFPIVQSANTWKATINDVGNTLMANVNFIPAIANLAYAIAGPNSAQPNIVSLGTLTSIDCSGNANIGTFGNSNVFIGNSSTLNNANISSNLVVYGNISGHTISATTITGNFSGIVANATHALYADNVINAAQPNITSVGTLGTISVTGASNLGGMIISGPVVAVANTTATVTHTVDVTIGGTPYKILLST